MKKASFHGAATFGNPTYGYQAGRSNIYDEVGSRYTKKGDTNGVYYGDVQPGNTSIDSANGYQGFNNLNTQPAYAMPTGLTPATRTVFPLNSFASPDIGQPSGAMPVSIQIPWQVIPN